MNKRVITCVGYGSWYPDGVRRLNRSLDAVGCTVERRLYDHLPPGCPSHKENPYAFKVWAFKRAMEEGFESILWVDSSVLAIRPIDPIFDMIEARDGFFMGDGWNIGQWCTTQAFQKIKSVIPSADHAALFNKTLLWAASMGLNMNSKKCKDFLLHMELMANSGAFIGPWKIEESVENKNILGHRHDQTCASVIVDHLGIYTTPCGESPIRIAMDNPPAEVLMMAQGL